MRKRSSFSGLFAAILIMASQTMGMMISISPATGVIDVGSTGTFDVVVSEIEPYEHVAVYDLTIEYDNSILEVVSVDFTDVLGDEASGDAIYLKSCEQPGMLNVAGLSLFDADAIVQAGSIKLTSVTFNALKYGVSDLILTVNELGNAYANTPEYSLQNGRVNAVPEPGSGMLLGCGIGALVLFARKKKPIR